MTRLTAILPGRSLLERSWNPAYLLNEAAADSVVLSLTEQT